MQKKIKLIWDFRGLESIKIAQHHCVHLKEFAEKESLPYYNVEAQEINEYYSIASITVANKDMITYRDALKPHRGEIA